MTAWHVIRDNTGQATVDFYLPSGETLRLKADIVASDKTWDLAALVVKRPYPEPLPAIRVASVNPQLGDSITVAGFGSHGLASYREVTGTVVDFCSPTQSPHPDIMTVSVKARNGDSGGPLISQWGYLKGVLFGSSDGTYGSHCGRVRFFLKGKAATTHPELVQKSLQLYPLFQFDWKINENFLKNLRFPLTLGVLYDILNIESLTGGY
jgi:hypothetical protein